MALVGESRQVHTLLGKGDDMKRILMFLMVVFLASCQRPSDGKYHEISIGMPIEQVRKEAKFICNLRYSEQGDHNAWLSGSVNCEGGEPTDVLIHISRGKVIWIMEYGTAERLNRIHN